MELGIFVTVDNISSARAIFGLYVTICVGSLDWTGIWTCILTEKRLKAWQPAFMENQTHLTNSVGKNINTLWYIYVHIIVAAKQCPYIQANLDLGSRTKT